MKMIKYNNRNFYEILALVIVYIMLCLNFFLFKDSIIAVFSAFFGITYTMLAGRGNPICYLFGVSGSGLYSWLSFSNALWGNLFLYLLYYIPMQILGFVKWNKNLKTNKYEIKKTMLTDRERALSFLAAILASVVAIVVLICTNDKNPVIDGITTVFSILGMYYTVRRVIEQWAVWMLVNALSSIMWIEVAMEGKPVMSTVLMWLVYFILAVYFYFSWKKEIEIQADK